jgi:hypothetical protein
VDIRVIGGGLGRTGTTSLKAALEQLLSGPCHHMFEVAVHQDEQVPMLRAALRGEAVDWPTLLDGYRAVVDWPGVAFWRELTQQWPEALVLVSHRDFDSWYESASSTIFGFQTRETDDDQFSMFLHELFRERFTLDLGDRDAVKACFDAHYAAVAEGVPAERRLDWTVTDGWAPICEALDLPVPDEPFPRLNTREEWLPKED